MLNSLKFTVYTTWYSLCNQLTFPLVVSLAISLTLLSMAHLLSRIKQTVWLFLPIFYSNKSVNYKITHKLSSVRCQIRQIASPMCSDTRERNTQEMYVLRHEVGNHCLNNKLVNNLTFDHNVSIGFQIIGNL